MIGVLQDVPVCDCCAGKWFLPWWNQGEATYQSTLGSPHLQHYLFMHVQCVPTVRCLYKYNFS